MPTEQRMVITGMSRLAIRVANLLVERGATVTVIADDDDDPIISALPDTAAVVLDAGTLGRTLNAAGADPVRRSRRSTD
jgi:Trk K+ transport system NAD-binding subunit